MTMAPTSSPVALLRGYQSRLSDLKEQFHVAYLQGIAAAAGCMVSKLSFDDGIDMDLKQKVPTYVDDQVARIEIQLKATVSKPTKTGIAVPIKNYRFNELAIPNPSIPKILVAMQIPSQQSDWIERGGNHLRLHHHCYWVNLDGRKLRPDNDTQSSVTVPTSNVLDDVSLCQIMMRIGTGGKP